MKSFGNNCFNKKKRDILKTLIPSNVNYNTGQRSSGVKIQYGTNGSIENVKFGEPSFKFIRVKNWLQLTPD